ncbi:MAG: hypothetical protein FWG07_04090 [Treponema sp.]|nr:hypothetical protein [Treponema sp.]
MFDNVTFKINSLPQNYILRERVKILYQNGIDAYRGKLKNMSIWQNHNYLIIHGSLPKYLKGENITPLNKEEVMAAIKKLEQDVAICLKSAIVCSAEFGTSIITKEKPFEYLCLFGNTKRFTRVEYSKWTGIETVNYTTPTGSFEFIGYDKIKEMLDKKQDIPPLFNGSNVLRLEYKIKKKRGYRSKIQRRFISLQSFR